MDHIDSYAKRIEGISVTGIKTPLIRREIFNVMIKRAVAQLSSRMRKGANPTDDTNV